MNRLLTLPFRPSLRRRIELALEFPDLAIHPANVPQDGLWGIHVLCQSHAFIHSLCVSCLR